MGKKLSVHVYNELHIVGNVPTFRWSKTAIPKVIGMSTVKIIQRVLNVFSRVCDQIYRIKIPFASLHNFIKYIGLKTMQKSLTAWTTANYGKFLKKWECLTTLSIS